MDKHLSMALECQAAFVLGLGVIKTAVARRWSWSKFYLGLDVAFAALGNGVTNLVDILREWDVKPYTPVGEIKARLSFSILFLFISLAAMGCILLIHQKWRDEERYGPKPQRRMWRVLWLGVIANGAGIATLFTFAYLRVQGDL